MNAFGKSWFLIIAVMYILLALLGGESVKGAATISQLYLVVAVILSSIVTLSGND